MKYVAAAQLSHSAFNSLWSKTGVYQFMQKKAEMKLFRNVVMFLWPFFFMATLVHGDIINADEAR
jgi:hypothetical protein